MKTSDGLRRGGRKTPAVRQDEVSRNPKISYRHTAMKVQILLDLCTKNPLESQREPAPVPPNLQDGWCTGAGSGERRKLLATSARSAVHRGDVRLQGEVPGS